MSAASTVFIKCNWPSGLPGRSAKDTVKMFLEDEGKKLNFEDSSQLIDLSTTVNFLKPEPFQVPVINLKIEDDNIYIDELIIFCDTKTVEFFGNNDMYNTTQHGIIIESSEEFSVYQYKLKLEQTKEMTMKLIRRSNNDFFWIYAIILKLKKGSVDKPPSSSSINFDNVNSLLKGCHISDSAKHCLEFMKAAQSNGASYSQLQDMFKPPVKPDDYSKLAASLNASVMNDLKTYIDYKFQVMTELMILREKHMNDKLDYILECIKSKNK